MKHRIVTVAQMKAIEQAGNAHGLPYLQMMESAGLTAYAELKSPALCWWSAERATTAGTVLSSPAPLQKRAGKWEVVILHDIWNPWHGCGNCGKCL